MDKVTTPFFRVAYPNIFKSKTNDLNGKEEFSLVALFPKNADLSPLKASIQQVITVKWGSDKSKWPTNFKNPLRDQGERGKIINGKKVLPNGYEEGAIFVTLKSSERPGVVDQKLQPILDASEFYAGCWARATIRPYAYSQKGNNGTAFWLIHLQKTKEGDPISGRSKAEDDFSPITQDFQQDNDDLMFA